MKTFAKIVCAAGIIATAGMLITHWQWYEFFERLVK